MRIKVAIKVAYWVDPNDYHCLNPDYSQEEAIQAIELHSLSKAIAEVMPEPLIDSNGCTVDNQVLEIKLEE